MTKKTIVIIEFVLIVLATIVISVFGLAPDTWRDGVPAKSIEITNVSDETNDITVSYGTENGEQVVRIKLPSNLREYKLKWKITPDNVTKNEVRFVSTAISEKLIEIHDDGTVVFLTSSTQGVQIVVQTTDGTNLRVTVIITFRSSGSGGDIEL